MARTPKSITTKALQDLLSQWILTRGKEQKYNYQQYENLLRYDTVTSVANASLKLGIIAMIGKYCNESSEDIETYGRESLERMANVLDSFWSMCLSYLSHGTSICHIKHIMIDRLYYLDEFTFISPDDVYFYQENRQITKIRIKGIEGEVPYAHIFHLINEEENNPGKTNPFGFALCARAYRYWDLEELLFTTFGVIGQKQADKLLVAKIPDTDAPVQLDEIDPATGQKKETTAGQETKEQLESIENNSVIVMEIGDELEAIDQGIKGEFFDFAFHHLATKRFLSFYQSQTTFSGNKSGVGDAGLAESQKETLLNLLEAIAKKLVQEFIAQVLRLGIDANFGKQKDYGYFTIKRQDPKALEVAALIIEVLTKDGVIPGESTDITPEVIDKKGKVKTPAKTTRVTNDPERLSAYEKLKDLVGY